jgi:ABC-2 type transport system permease protein
VTAGLVAWGFVLPVIYATFGADFRALVEGGYFGQLLDVFSAFGGGNVLTLTGSVSLGFIHPIPIALAAILAVGVPIASLAGERQRGTLEVLLARPISRRRVYATVLAATTILLVLALAGDLAGTVVGAAAFDVLDELDPGLLLVAWAGLVLLLVVIGAIALAASASSDWPAPALGAVLGFALVSYAIEFVGTLWPDAAGLRPWSLFHYFQPAKILAGDVDPADPLVLVVVGVAATAFGLWRFPRRDLAAPG